MRVVNTLQRLYRAAMESAETGMSTAEYAIGTIAAASFAALLIAVIKAGSVEGMLEGVIGKAFGVAG